MKSTFRILFYVRKNQPNKNSNLPIMIRITMDGHKVQFNSKLEVQPDLWDVNRGRAKGNTAKAMQMNSLLNNIRATITTRYTKMMNEVGFASPEKIRDSFLGIEDREQTLICYSLKLGPVVLLKKSNNFELNFREYDTQNGINKPKTKRKNTTNKFPHLLCG